MTNKTIPDLTAGTAPDGTEVIETVQGGVSVKLTLAQLLTRIASANGISLVITAGGSTGTHNAGNVTITGGEATSLDQWNGGDVFLTGGVGTWDGGDASVTGGVGERNGGAASISGGDGTTNGGSTVLNAGASALATGGLIHLDGGEGAVPGDIILIPGSDGGSARGFVSIQSPAIQGLPVTVANLPAAATAGNGARAFVTDALTTLALGIGTVVANGGANKVPVYSDGTNWLYG